MKQTLLKTFLLCLSISAGMTASAQKTDKQVATLQHGDQTTVFYGSNAFKQAYDAAADTLDVITLSSGEFYFGNKNIEKSITVYGAGFEDDLVTGTLRTYVMELPAISTSGVHLEGICFSDEIHIENSHSDILHDISIAKCSLPYLLFKADCNDFTVRQSYLSGFIGSWIYYWGGELGWQPEIVVHNLLVSNSFIQGYEHGSAQGLAPFNSFDVVSTIHVDHCILMSSNMAGPWHYTNNVISGFDFWEANYSHNIFLGDEPLTKSGDNWVDVAPEYVWAAEGEDGVYAENKDFALKYPEVYIGTDGTLIGLHGGIYGWNKIPSTPRITECIIDTENVANGTLKVNIKAEAQTKE